MGLMCVCGVVCVYGIVSVHTHDRGQHHPTSSFTDTRRFFKKKQPFLYASLTHFTGCRARSGSSSRSTWTSWCVFDNKNIYTYICLFDALCVTCDREGQTTLPMHRFDSSSSSSSLGPLLFVLAVSTSIPFPSITPTPSPTTGPARAGHGAGAPSRGLPEPHAGQSVSQSTLVCVCVYRYGYVT